MTTLLVVGGGLGQLPAIIRAKEMGITVVAVDRDPRAPGLTAANFSQPIDVIDVDGVINFARECQVDGAMTMQSDLPVATVAAVCDALGLTGVSPEAAHWCSNKGAMREKLEAAGISQPDFRLAFTESDLMSAAIELGMPVVVKAPESSGSRGVTVVSHQDQLHDAYLSALNYSPGGAVIVERFVQGLELGAQTLSLDGSCQVVLIHDDQMTPPPAVVPIGHSYPANLRPEDRAAVEEQTRRAVEALGIRHGPANVDLILTPDGVPHIIEIGARIGATCLPELTSYHSGFDWVQAAILCALGETPDIPPFTSVPAAARVLTSEVSGTLKSWSLRDESVLDGIVDWELEVCEGSAVKAFTKGPDRIGRIMATGESVGQALGRLDAFMKSIDLVIDEEL